MKNMKWAVAAFATICSLALMPGRVAAQDADNSIEKIEGIQTANGVLVTIQLKKPAAGVPASFSVANPARIAIDLPNTTSNLQRSAVELNQGDLRSINVVQAQGRTRVVLNLVKSGKYNVTTSGNNVLVALGGVADTTSFAAAPSAPAAPSATAPSAPSAAPGAQVAAAAPTGRALRAIDFRRGPDGEGRVVVDLADPNTSVDIRQQGQSVIVDFLSTSLPETLRRRLDVTDFGTPVQMVSTTQQGGNVRMVIEPKGTWEHNAYQSDNRFVVEVKPVREDPTRLFPNTRPGYQGERLSLNFQNVDIRSLLQVIADFTNLNIITSDSVQGSITLRLKDVPWDQALDIILQSKGLDMRKNGNVLLIAPRDELATREKLALESQAQVSDLEPLRTETVVVNYQKADDVRKLLSDEKQRMLSKRGSVVVDARTNQMFIQDTPSRLDEIRRLIQRIDIPVRQVLIEARIVEASDTFSRNLGVRFGFARITNNAWLSSGATGQGASFGPATGVGGSNGSISIGSTTIASPNNVNLPASGIGGFDASSIGLTLVNDSLTALLNLEISALEQEGRGKIISSPRVITADKIKAVIEQGTEIPYQAATSSGATNVQFRKAVLKLEVTPQITPEGAIFLDVKVNKDSRGAETLSGPAIDTKNVQTQVLVDNGGTVVLGGIFEQNERTTVTKVPVLGDIPVVGYLFKNRSVVNDRTELMIFITPRVISEALATAVR